MNINKVKKGLEKLEKEKAIVLKETKRIVDKKVIKESEGNILLEILDSTPLRYDIRFTKKDTSETMYLSLAELIDVFNVTGNLISRLEKL